MQGVQGGIDRIGILRQEAIRSNEPVAGQIHVRSIQGIPAHVRKVHAGIRRQPVYLPLDNVTKPAADHPGIAGKIAAAIIQRGEVRLIELLQCLRLAGDTLSPRQSNLVMD